MRTKISMEFPIKSSAQLLFQYLSSSSGLSEWFADNVISRGNIYSFIWDDYEEKAKLAQKKQDEKVKFRWLDEDGNETDKIFEFIIDIDEITNDVVLIINDTCDDDTEVEDQKLLWENQINDLKKIIGSN